MKQQLFVTDLDNTLIGDNESLEQLNRILQTHRRQFGTKIVYATGRSLFLYQQLFQDQPMLMPDALICSVGTEVYLDPENGEIDQDWANWLSQNWERDKILELTINQFPELIPQSNSEQGYFKISFYLSSERTQESLTQLKQTLLEHHLDVKVIYSSSQDVDLVPTQADKGLAVQFLQRKWEINDSQTVVCGDSGNDIALFSAGNPYGILVGNAQPELRKWYQQYQTNYRYLANQFYAAGILEGLSYFNLLELSKLKNDCH